MHKIVNRYVDQTRIGAIQKTLNQPSEKAAQVNHSNPGSICSKNSVMCPLDGVSRPKTTQNTNENVVQVAEDHVTTLIFSIALAAAATLRSMTGRSVGQIHTIARVIHRRFQLIE